MFFKLMFEPEVAQPLKTLDLPLGGSVSPVDALSLLIELLAITGGKGKDRPGDSAGYEDDATGDDTIFTLKKSLAVMTRISGNSSGSLGLHPAFYFYNERGKHSRFLFLGLVSLVEAKLRNNDQNFFRAFTQSRRMLEQFLIDNKSLLGILLQNTSRTSRVSRISQLINFLVQRFSAGYGVSAEEAITEVGAKGRFFDITSQVSTQFSDESKSSIFLRHSIESAIRCPLCQGLLDPSKSVSYDHIHPVRDGGKGGVENGQLVHPFCNTGVKS